MFEGHQDSKQARRQYFAGAGPDLTTPCAKNKEKGLKRNTVHVRKFEKRLCREDTEGNKQQSDSR